MNVRELMTRDPEACLPGDTLATAGEIMRRRNCGFVPVVDGHISNRLVGVLTDRDVALHLTTFDRPASRVRADACMTRTVHTIGLDAGLDEAAAQMERYAVHRLPVLSHGRLIGILSLSDIVAAGDRRSGFAGWEETERKATEIIEAIAASR